MPVGNSPSSKPDDPVSLWRFRYAQHPQREGQPSPAALRLCAWLEQLEPRPLPPVRLLELGCGYGHDVRCFAAAGLSVVAADVSEPLLEGMQNLPGVQTLLIDLLKKLPVEKCSFDLVFSHLVLSCDFELEQLEYVFAELFRVLKPGARAWLVVRSTSDPTYLAGHQPGAGRLSLGDTGLFFFSRKLLRRLSHAFEIELLEEHAEQVVGEWYGVIEARLRRPSKNGPSQKLR